MSYTKVYGWEKYKEEGLAELKRIKSSKYFSGKKELIILIDRYIELFKKEGDTDEITGKDLYPELVKQGDTKPAFDKASKQVGKLRKELELFYNSDEGKQTSYMIYFVSPGRDYRLGVRKINFSENIFKKNNQDFLFFEKFSAIKLSKIKEIIINFLKIFIEAFWSPAKLVERAKKSGSINIDAFIIFILCNFLVAVIAGIYLDSIKTQLILKYYPDLNLILFLSYIIDFIKIFFSDMLFSFKTVFIIFRFIILFGLLPWVLNKILFKGSATLYEFINFQLYFLSIWTIIFIWIGFANLHMVFLRKDNTLLALIAIALLFLSFLMHFKGLKILFNFSWKKGILSYLVYLLLVTLIIKL